MTSTMQLPAIPASVRGKKWKWDEEQLVVLKGIDWRSYLWFLKAIGNRHVRTTYDGWNLQIMAPSINHEHYSSIIGSLIKTLAMESDFGLYSSRCVTLKLKKKQKGLEPDESFYFTSVPVFRGIHVDLRRGPPPDLALEIDITTGLLDRQEIYAKFGVPEVWRFNGKHLRFLRLNGKKYDEMDKSLWFPKLNHSELEGFFCKIDSISEKELYREFQDWARKQV